VQILKTVRREGTGNRNCTGMEGTGNRNCNGTEGTGNRNCTGMEGTGNRNCTETENCIYKQDYCYQPAVLRTGELEAKKVDPNDIL
jgi:hypothetical protein